MSATTAPALRTSLAATLAGYLGTYTLANGSTTPAISVRGPADGLPAATSVTGLECVILRDPDLPNIVAYKANMLRPVWTVFLIGWNQQNDIIPAAVAVVNANPGTTAERVIVDDNVGPSQQIRLEIPGAGAI